MGFEQDFRGVTRTQQRTIMLASGLEVRMAKEMRCGDLMPGCDKVLEGKDEREVMAKASEHARKDHDIQNMTPDLQEKVRDAIHDKR